LLHIANVLTPISIAHSTLLKEKYVNVRGVLEKIKYNEVASL